MLYKQNSLTEEKAKKIIGEKMNLRIEFLNKFAKKYGYKFLLHSTDTSNVDSILKDGLQFSASTSDSINELLTNSSIPESHLKKLESSAKKYKRTARSESLYETNATYYQIVTHYPQISAKTLLEYSHKDNNATVVCLVPEIPAHEFATKKENDKFALFTPARPDYHLRRKVCCSLINGEIKYESSYLYPLESIAFAFDRDKILIKTSSSYDETYYFNKTFNKKIKKGSVIEALKNPEKISSSSFGTTK